MDWGRAKSILIIMLLALNIFLLANIFLISAGDAFRGQDVSAASRILEKRGVGLKCRIPASANSVGKLFFKETAVNRPAVFKRLFGSAQNPPSFTSPGAKIADGSKTLNFEGDNSFTFEDKHPSVDINLAGPGGNGENIKKLLAEMRLPVSSFYLDGTTNNPDGTVTCVLYEKYGGYAVFDNYAVVTALDGRLASLKWHYKKPENIVPGARKIISASQILLKNYIAGDKAVITSIDLGFMEYKLERDTKELYGLPVWRIRTEDGKTRYFKASDDGGEIT